MGTRRQTGAPGATGLAHPPAAGPSGPFAAGRKAIWGWCLFDWANSPFPTIITTFVFSAYFTKAVALTPEQGTSQWGWMVGLSGLLIAILGPLMGAVADRCGRRKPLLAFCSLMCIVATALLWFVRPSPDDALWALICAGIAIVGFEVGTVFYNAMLPGLVEQKYLGRLSGWAWGLGYAGGLVALVLALFAFVQADPPPFGLDKGAAEHIRITAPLVSLWFVVFAVPLFLWVPDGPRRESLRTAWRHGVDDMGHLWRTLRSHPTVGRFLVARMIYIDGLNTLFAFGGIYAAGTFGMGLSQIILLGIAMNVTAGIGAAVFGSLDDRFGARRVIVLSVLAILVLCCALLAVQSTLMFWLLAVPLGIFFGPAQSASRSLMARLAPAELRNEMFGLYAVSGKVTSFAGPMVLAVVTAWTDSQRWGMSTILLFLIGGLVLLRRVPVR